MEMKIMTHFRPVYTDRSLKVRTRPKRRYDEFMNCDIFFRFAKLNLSNDRKCTLLMIYLAMTCVFHFLIKYIWCDLKRTSTYFSFSEQHSLCAISQILPQFMIVFTWNFYPNKSTCQNHPNGRSTTNQMKGEKCHIEQNIYE